MSDQPVYDALQAAADLLRGLEEVATPSPWRAGRSSTDDDVPLHGPNGNILCASPDDGVRGGHWTGDADLIVALRPVAAPLAEWLEGQAEKSRLLHGGRWADDPFAIRLAHAVLGRPTSEVAR